MTRVAIIFDNFGPYHVARLRAATAVCDLLAIEIAARSGTYAWQEVPSARDFRRTTLIEKGTSDEGSRSAIIRRLEKTLDGFEPEVVVVPGWGSPAAWSAMRWCLRRRVPMVCLSDSTVWDEPRAGWKEAIKRMLVRPFASALVAGSRARDYMMKLGFPGERIFSGFDTVDNLYFHDRAALVLEREDEARRQYGLPAAYFLASARFVEKKNLAFLLEAYAIYRSSAPTREAWSLVLLGDGALRPELERKMEYLGLRDHVFLPGFRQIEELPAYYALARAFILASTSEPWGLVVNEAMACGLPVLVSERCGCVEELVHDGVNGFRFDPVMPHVLVRRMSELASSDFPLDEFRRQSLALVAQWGPDRFAQGLSAAVQSALAQPVDGSHVLPRLLLNLLLGR